MSGHYIIDGNNLLHTMHAQAPVRSMGRETLVRTVEQWARRQNGRVTIVFDGSAPGGGLLDQMQSGRVNVIFSGRQTADDVIVEMAVRAKSPNEVTVITSDKAVGHAARYHRCSHSECNIFVTELYSRTADSSSTNHEQPSDADKPPPPSGGETQKWLDLFDIDEEDELNQCDRPES